MPEISIVIPIHNEANYLEESVTNLCAELEKVNITDYELILVENGSTDRTQDIVIKLASTICSIRIINLDKGDYGAALREGMKASEGKYIINYDLDYWDVTFLRKTVLLLREFEYNIIIASKNLLLSKDEREPIRRFISQGFRLFLLLFFGLKVSDTHGIKAWKNDESLKQLLKQTRFTRHIFDTELVIRGQKYGLNIIELPMTVIENRPSTTKTIIKRIPEAILDLTLLWWELRIRKNYVIGHHN